MATNDNDDQIATIPDQVEQAYQTALDQAIKNTLHDIDTARIMLFFAQKAVQQKSMEMMEQLRIVHQHIAAGGPMDDNLLMSVAPLQRALRREKRSSAPVPTWERTLKRHIEQLDMLKEMRNAEEV